MPSVFTIEGTDVKLEGKKKCKTVPNPKTGCSMQLCPVPKTKKNRTGWAFKKGSLVCSRKKKR
jgi:hypothetical protein